MTARKIFVRAIFFRRRENLGNDSQRRRDQNRPKIVKIGAILAIFRPFEISTLDLTLDSTLDSTSDLTLDSTLRGVPNVWGVTRISKLNPSSD